jgi:hypothetical protein
VVGRRQVTGAGQERAPSAGAASVIGALRQTTQPCPQRPRIGASSYYLLDPISRNKIRLGSLLQEQDKAAEKKYRMTVGPSMIEKVCIHGARLVQLHKQLHEQLHNFNSQTANSLTNSLVSFSDNSLSQS